MSIPTDEVLNSAHPAAHGQDRGADVGTPRLRSLETWLRRRVADPLTVDVAVTVAFVAVTVYEGHITPAGWRRFDAWAYLLVPAAALRTLPTVPAGRSRHEELP